MRRRAASYVVAAASLIVVAAGSLSQADAAAQNQPAVAPAAGVTLDYDFFKTRVQPVFLQKREGHARCVVCHENNNVAFHVVPRSPGATTWNEDQSRQNFILIQRVAIPGNPDSPLIKHPLDEKAGGDPHHGGGQQFETQQDAAWQTLRAFVMGQRAG